MAGVPGITAQMLDGLTGTLEGGVPLLSVTVGCWVAESEIAEMLATVERTHEGTQIGSYPFFREGKVGTNFVIRSVDSDTLKTCASALISQLATLGRDGVLGGI
jgi:molybdopterin-biosynthesis enzyme MoeA-like protein